MSGLPLMPPCRLPTKAQSSACRLQAELEKLRSVGPLDSSEAEEVTQLKVELGGGESGKKGPPGRLSPPASRGHCLGWGWEGQPSRGPLSRVRPHLVEMGGGGIPKPPRSHRATTSVAVSMKKDWKFSSSVTLVPVHQDLPSVTGVLAVLVAGHRPPSG